MNTTVQTRQFHKCLTILLVIGAILIGFITAKVYAEPETVVYFVDSVNGNDSNTGLTDTSPVKTVDRAAALAKADGNTNVTMVLMSTTREVYDLSKLVANTDYRGFDFNFTGKNGDTLYDSRIYFVNSNSSVSFFHSNVSIDYLEFTGYPNKTSTTPTQPFLYLNGYNLYVGEHCSTEKSSFGVANLKDHGVELANWPLITIVAGTYSNGNSYNLPEGTGHSITLLSGTFGRVVGVNRGNKYNSGSEGHPFNESIHIGGTAELALVVGASSEQYNVYTNSEILVDGGYIYRLVGSNLGFPISGSTTFQTHYGDTNITVNGGVIEKLVGSAMGRNTPYVKHIGDTTININGGVIGEVQGGGALGDNHGDITINMTGGVITPVGTAQYPFEAGKRNYTLQSPTPMSNGNIYGAGSGISDLMVWADISSGNVTSLGNTFGHVSVNMTGGTVNGTVFGGGHGYDYKTTYGSDAFYNIAQVLNGTEVNISGNAHITGDVYGGGDGYEISELIAKVSPETSVTVNPNAVIIDGNVYGGGNHALTDGNTNVTIAEGTILNNVYGAASNSPVTGNVTLTIEENTHISGDVYGGGSNGSVGGNVSINIASNTQIDGSVYGGGEHGDVEGGVTINVGESSVIGNIFGGGENGNVGQDTTIIIGNDTVVSGSIYGGGEHGKVGGNATIQISEGAIIGDIYGGGDNGSVDGNTSIEIGDYTTVQGTIFGGGKSGNVGGDTNISIGANTEVGTVIGGCSSGEVSGNTGITVTGPVQFNPTIDGVAIAGGGLNGKTDGNVSISLKDVEVDGNVYDGGVGADAVVDGDVTLEIENVVMDEDSYFYVGGGSGSVHGDIGINKDDSDITFKVSDDNSERPAGSFNGWNISDGNGISVVQTSGDTFKLDEGEYEMTISWNPVTLMFHTDGYATGTMTNQKIAINSETPIKAHEFTSRFSLKGWALAADSTVVAYPDRHTIKITGEDLADLSFDDVHGYYLNLYAVWDDPREAAVVKIPKVLVVDGVKKEGAYSVLVQATTKTSDWTISVVPDSELELISVNKENVIATISQEKTSWDIGNDTTLTAINGGIKTTGKISAPGLTAGKWKGTFNFKIQVLLDEDK